VTTPPDFETDPKRDATDSIRGYVYQAYQSVLAWMQLKETEILVLEGSEDFDIHSGSSVATTQIKDVSGKLTLRSQAVIDSLNNYWACNERNTDFNIALRFLTTAEAGQEQGSPFGSGQKGLEYWNSAESDRVNIEPLHAFLNTLKLDPDLATFIKNATSEKLHEKLISRIKWDMGNRPMEGLQYNIEDLLKIHGLKLGINSRDSCQALPHLLKKVADLLSTKGMKELRYSDFLTCFDTATSVSIPRGEMAAMISGRELQQRLGMPDYSERIPLANIAPIIGKPIPIVDGGIARTNVVSKLSTLLSNQNIIFLCGSSGLGKTNLASLISREVGGCWGWAGFRGMPPEQIKDVLARASFEMNAGQLQPLLVLDDIDLSQVARFEREFISLVFSIIDANGMVIVTGPTRPPLLLLPKLWKSEKCEASVPYFDENEVAEMVRAHGLSDGKRVSEWARTIWFTTSGHPQLVHARVRNLSAKGWPAIELSDLTEPEDVERVREEARSRLVNEFPHENTRVLAYRLSLTIGAFSRETAIAVAMTPPSLSLPGEAFDSLIGPWVEREGENRYRISPLLTGAANNILSELDINAVHGAIALSIIHSKGVSQFEISTAFFHAYKAKHVGAITMLVGGIIKEDATTFRLLYDAMSWLTLLGLEEGQKILPENPSIDLMLRLVQYKLIAVSPEPDKAVVVIDRIEETLNEIKIPEVKLSSESLAYQMVLSTIEVQIPSSMVIRILSRMIDIADEDSGFKQTSDSSEVGQDVLPLIGENKPEQILFLFQAVRVSGLDDLSDLVTSLDALPPNKRDQLLMVCNSDTDFASLLVNRAWWKEVKDGALDVNKALQVFELTVMKSREWKVPELTKACLVVKSVIQDEYGHSTERALDVLDAADQEFPDEASLINQRAKVLFHANRDLEALPIAYKALELPALSNVEFIFCCRTMGIATAKSGNWPETERLFLLGAKKAKDSSVQENMAIGLLADAAFALWKQKKYEKCLLLFADILDSLETVTLSEDIRIRHLHATVRHSICWVHVNARGADSTDLVEPFPGMCSNQEPHEGIKDYEIIDIGGAWELLAITESVLGLDIGIKERAQAAAGEKKQLYIEEYARTTSFELIFKNKDFENLVPQLIGMLEGLSHYNALEKGEEVEYPTDNIPKLPNTFWDNPGNCDWVFHYLLVACVISTAYKQAAPLPIKRWRTDLEKAGALVNDIDKFFDVLNGDHPDDTLYQQAAAAILQLRNGALAPERLWVVTFRLLNVIMNEKRWGEKPLEELLIPRWIFAASNQCFAFSTPSLVCPIIEKCCSDQSFSGLVKIAAVLKIAAPYLNIPLSKEAKLMINKIIEQT